MYDYSPKRKKADESKCATQVKRIHPAPIIAIWIALSSAVILMNAWILSPKGEGDGGLGFPYPIFLTVRPHRRNGGNETLIRVRDETDHSPHLRHDRDSAHATIYALD